MVTNDEALDRLSADYDRIIEKMRAEVAYFDGLLRIKQIVTEMQSGDDDEGVTTAICDPVQ